MNTTKRLSLANSDVVTSSATQRGTQLLDYPEITSGVQRWTMHMEEMQTDQIISVVRWQKLAKSTLH